MAKQILVVVGLWLAVFASTLGGQRRGTTELGFRVGAFSNTTNELAHSNDVLRLKTHKTMFYIEGFLNYYLTDFAALALNLGSYSKGEIRFDIYYNNVYDGSFVGQASVYPVQLGLKLSPFQKQLPLASQPYVEGGGAIIVGREAATLGTYNSVFANYTDGTLASETDFNWWMGGGVEIPIARTIQLDFMVKYINTKFSGDIVGIKDYSGWQITAGIGYLSFRKKK